MAITFSCVHCGTTFKVGDQYAGKKTNCRNCKQLLTIPQPAEEAEADIGFADADPAPSQTRAIGRGSEGALAGGDEDPPDLGSLAGEEGGRPLMSALPMVDRSGDVSAFDLAGPAASQYEVTHRRPSRAGNDNITIFLVIGALLAAVAAIVMGYVSWPPAEKLKLLADKNLPADTLKEVGTPHLYLVLPHLISLISVFILLAPAVTLAWFASVRVTNGTLPQDVYRRSLGIACLPFIAAGLLALTPVGRDFQMLMLAQLLAAPIAWLIFDRIHGAHGAEGGVAIGIAVVAVGLCVAGVNFGVGMVTDGSKLAYDQNVQIAMQRNIEKRDKEERAKREADELAARQREAAAAEAARKKAAETAAASMTGQPDPAVEAVASAQKDLEQLDQSLQAGTLNRESATDALAAAKTVIADGKAKFATRAEWIALETRLAEAEPMVAKLPSSKPDPSIYTPPDVIDQWSVSSLNVEQEVSLGPVNFRIPTGGRLLANPKQPTVLDFESTSGRAMKFHAEVFPVVDPKQARPWLIVSAAQAQPTIFSIEAAADAVVTSGKFKDVPFTRISEPGRNPGEGRRVTFASRVDNNWVLFRVESGAQTEEGLDPILTSVSSCRVRRAGENPVDPYSARVLVAEAAKGVTPELVAAMTDKKQDAEAEILKVLDRDAGDEPLKLYGQVLPAVASERSVKYLWKMAEPGRVSVAEARGALSTLDPKNAEPLRFALLDLNGKDLEARTQAIDELAAMDIDQKRRAEVTKALIGALEDASFLRAAKNPNLETVLFRWGNEYVFNILLKVLNDENADGNSRVTAIGALSQTASSKYVGAISRWILKEPETVVVALKRMGQVGESEAGRLLSDKNPEARKYAAAVLEEVGTIRSLGLLQRAAKDTRAAGAAAAAQTAYEIVKARVEDQKSPGATQPAN